MLSPEYPTSQMTVHKPLLGFPWQFDQIPRASSPMTWMSPSQGPGSKVVVVVVACASAEALASVVELVVAVVVMVVRARGAALAVCSCLFAASRAPGLPQPLLPRTGTSAWPQRVSAHQYCAARTGWPPLQFAKQREPMATSVQLCATPSSNAGRVHRRGFHPARLAATSWLQLQRAARRTKMLA